MVRTRPRRPAPATTPPARASVVMTTTTARPTARTSRSTRPRPRPRSPSPLRHAPARRTPAPTNAGDYTASASFGADQNHTGSSDSKDFTINKAASATAVSFAPAVSPITYDALGHAATATVTGAGGLSQPAAVTYTKDASL